MSVSSSPPPVGTSRGRSAPPLVACSRAEDIPLSFVQQRLWFVEQLEPGSASYNVHFLFRLRGPLNVGALDHALQEVVRRHEVLRTSFPERLGQSKQVISPAPAFALSIEDLEPLPETERASAMQARARREAQAPFDLTQPPLFRATLLRLDEHTHALVLVTHHIVCDNWSIGVLIGEMSAVYRARVAGAPSPLPALAVQYADFTVWQRRWLAGAELDHLLGYWQRQLAGAPAVLELPSDRPRPAARSTRGARMYPELPAALVTALAAFSRQAGVTLFMTLLAGFDTLLWRYSGQTDLVVGTPVAGRNRRELEGLIGFFANTLVLRVGVDPELSFRDLVKRVRTVCLEAYAHQDVPFEKLVDALKLERDLSRTPLVQVMFGLQNTPFAQVELGESTLEPVMLDAGTSNFDLTVSLEVRDGRITSWVEYNTDLFDAATVERLMRHYRVVLEAAVARPDDRLDTLSLLSGAERRMIVLDWNRTQTLAPRQASVVELFEDQVRRTPDALAVIAGDTQLSYRELDARAELWAAALRARGCGPDVRVALALPRGPAFPMMVLAVLKAGGAYVPLDPAYPTERLAFMLRDCDARVLVTESAIATGLPVSPAQVLLVDEPPVPGQFPGDAAAGRPARAADLAYVIYTSGSTGRPKGVAMPHSAVRNLITWQCARSPEPARTLQFASPSFDVSFQELFATWGNGGCLVLASEEARRDPAELLRVCRAQQIERLFLPFVALHQLAEAAEGADLHGLRLRDVITAGEQLRITPAIAALFSQLPACRLYNQYGPTETHLATELALTGDPASWDALPSIGRPIGNVRIYVLDRDLQPAPIGVPGELYIAGAGVARDYIGRPDLTAERFLRDPFADGRMYRTGDRAKYLASGDLVFLGRSDDQVKVRGYRIELGEIEAALGAHPAVSEAAVVVRTESGHARLIAYVACVAGITASAAELKRHLRDQLPDYMVPAVVVMLPALPLTPNGKVDRKALPAPEVQRAPYVAPGTAMERVVAGVWEAVLGVTSLGATENFFEVGGHSLLAMQVVSRLRAALGAELAVRTLFEAPTIAELALRLEAATGAPMAVAEIMRASRAEPLPLSFAQQRLWFLDQLEPGGFTYNVPVFMRLGGALDVSALGRSLNAVVARHEVLRTRFSEVQGEPRHVITDALDVALDLEQVRERDVAERARREAQRPFDLGAGPLIRARLLRVRDDDHVLLLVLHHIVCDGWSMAILLRELGSVYRGLVAGVPAQLAALPIQYADFAHWQHQWLTGELLDDQLAYWKRQLAGAPPMLELPTDRPRPAVRTVRGAQVTQELGAELTAAVRALSQRAGATEFMTLLAAFYALLASYSGQHDLVVGSPIAGRGSPQTDELIGFFVNTLVLRASTDGDPTFDELVQRVREVCLGAYAHHELPFEKLVAELSPDRQPNRTPVFQVMFALQNALVTTLGTELGMTGMTASPLDVHPGMAKFDLTLLVHATPHGLVTAWEYNVELFDEATIARMASHYARLLETAVARPARRIADLPLLSEAERAQLLAWGTVRTAYPEHDSLHALFEAQVARTPAATAIVFGDARLSYAALNAQANRLARYLVARGVTREDRVGICLGRSIDFVVSVLAAIKAGACYVPLDPSYPNPRLAYMAADAGVRVVIMRRGPGAADLTGMTGTPIWLDAAEPELQQLGDANLPVITTSRDLGYMMYTSGSTGQPKGVCIEQRSIARLVLGTDYVQLDRHDVVAHLSNTSFDAATFEIWGALLTGATLHGIAPEVVMSPEAFARELATGGITTLLATAAVFQQIAAIAPGAFQAIEHLLVGGDVLDVTAVRRVLAAGRPRRLINAYGPTEATTCATWHLVGEVDDRAATLPIGRPIANTTIRILDARRHLVPIGVRGELYVGGPGVARGYWNRPALTAERFVDDPFEPGGRLYRTGDLAAWRADGAIEFHGRADGQIKLRGFRVELGEIEAQLLTSAELTAGTVIVRDDTGDQRLVAYVVPRAGAAPDPGAIQARLAAVLPSYMVPSAIVVLDQLPTTPNGKLDRQALPAPSPRREVSAAPRTAMEEIVGEIWGRVLKHDGIGGQDNFFALGGHSLLAMQVLSRISKVIGISVPVQRLFEAPTVAAFARAVEAQLTGGATLPVAGFAAMPRAGKLPLSSAQQRLWYLDRLAPGGFSYNVPVVLRLTGPLRIDVLARSLDAIAGRHEALRTRFVEIDGEPAQVIAPASAVARTLEVDHLAAGSDATLGLHAWAVREAQHPFALAEGPVFRAKLLALGPDHHALGLTLHHIVCDAWSIGILLRELQELYRAGLAGTEPALAPLGVQAVDIAIHQRDRRNDEVMAGQLAYWTAQLAGAPDRLELPTDRARPTVQTTRGAMVHHRLAPALAAAVRELGKRHGVTLFMTLLAGYYALLQRYSRQSDLVVGSPISERTHQELEDVIGFMLNTVALRVQIAGDASFETLLASVRDACLRAQACRDVPFDRVVDAVRPARDVSYTPVFQVMFVLHNAPTTLELPGLAVDPVYVDAGLAKFDLTLFAEDTGEALWTHWEYNADLFDAATIERMAGHYGALLEAAVARPQARLGALPLLTEPERRMIVEDWNRTQAPAPRQATVVELFEDQVRRTPDAIAVIEAPAARHADGELRISYRELDARAEHWAEVLRARGCGPRTRVALSLSRGPAFPVMVLAVLKTGAAYVPLDPAYPAERLAFMLEDCEARVLVTETALAAELPASAAEVLRIDAPVPPVPAPANRVGRAPTSDDVAYVIYTSGSTGRPKGVVMPHGPIVNLIAWQCARSPVPARTLQFASPSFDVSFQELFATWANGGCLVMASEEARRDPVELLRVCREQRIERLFLPFVALHQLAETASGRDLSGLALREVVTAGEQLRITPAMTWLFTQLPSCRLYNQYGPTETHVATELALTGAPASWDPLPSIGRPIANTRVYLLDDGRKPTPIGVPGELCIGGAAVARGYWNRPDLTAERFVDDPFEPGGRLYRTGDLASWRSDGTIAFHGRIDGQVKLRGFRVELGEIEAQLLEIADLAAATVALRTDTGDPRLVAYVVPRAGAVLELDAIQARLAAVLPRYMVPSAIVVLDRIPTSPNGKVDHRKLPAPSARRDDLGGHYVAPRGDVEHAIAQIWAEALGVDRVGANDNFFDLGGSSLLLVPVRSRIEAVFGRPVPMVVLAESPGLGELARRLGPSAAPATLASSCLVRLQRGGAATPMFFVHGGGGQALVYRELARAIDPDRTMYGFAARGLDRGEPLHTSVEDMASHYLDLAREVHPDGPYLLVGASLGGMIAYEMARRLTASGHAVPLCVMLDTPGPGVVPEPIADAADMLAFHLEGRGRISAAALRGHSLDDQLRLINDAARAAGGAPPFSDLAQGRRLVALWQNNSRAASRYTAPPWPAGQVEFFSAAEYDPQLPHHLERAWTDRCTLHVATAPGNHWTMVAPPHAAALGARIRRCLETRTGKPRL